MMEILKSLVLSSLSQQKVKMQAVHPNFSIHMGSTKTNVQFGKQHEQLAQLLHISHLHGAWVEVPPPGGWYIDGGLKRNNASEVALAEARRHWKSVNHVLIVSIGTGIQKTADFIENQEPPEKSTSEQVNTMKESQISKSPTLTGSMKRGIKRDLMGLAKTAASTAVAFTDAAAQYSRITGGVMTLKRFADEVVKLSTEWEDTCGNAPIQITICNDSLTTDLTDSEAPDGPLLTEPVLGTIQDR